MQWFGAQHCASLLQVAPPGIQPSQHCDSRQSRPEQQSPSIAQTPPLERQAVVHAPIAQPRPVQHCERSVQAPPSSAQLIAEHWPSMQERSGQHSECVAQVVPARPHVEGAHRPSAQLPEQQSEANRHGSSSVRQPISQWFPAQRSPEQQSAVAAQTPPGAGLQRHSPSMQPNEQQSE